ncbi:hypothetical protein SEUCBS139899_006391 [Sporothrix eucalyptigena]|uniref:Uncharacterized protein n=1 Tax=Sporothrix eucalyptigena TaxID=1812306 RepID=A0ABP0BDS4_9PEZI
MRHVAAHTTIPMPHVHTFSSAQDSAMGLAYVALDCIEDKMISELGFMSTDNDDMGHWWAWPGKPAPRRQQALYDGLAQIYPDLRTQTRPLNMEMLLQESESLDLTARLPTNKAFTKASDYLELLLSWGTISSKKAATCLPAQKSTGSSCSMPLQPTAATF